MALPVHIVVALRYVLDCTRPLYLSRNIANLRTNSNLPRWYVRFASYVTRVGDVSDVTSVNTVLQQCTGKVVKLNTI